MKFGKIKKTICILLAGTMVLGTSLTAFASEQTPADGTEYKRIRDGKVYI